MVRIIQNKYYLDLDLTLDLDLDLGLSLDNIASMMIEDGLEDEDIKDFCL